MLGDVIGTYLVLLGSLLAGFAVLVVAFVAIVGRSTRGRPVLTVLRIGTGIAVIILGLGTTFLAAALLAPVLVVSVSMVVLAAMGYTAWRLLRPSGRSSGR
jgi:hypothetical protein